MPEQQNIEFKQSWHDDYLKWVCGFANAQGGIIFIGKDDNGNVVDVEDYKKLMDDIPNKVRNLMGITVEVNLNEDGEYPVAAIREMLLNALVHRNYMGAPIQIRVYDNKITIWNDGALIGGLTEEALKRSHSSKPRNPIIAEVCFKGGMIDAWGRGTIKIIDTCKQAELPEPELKELDGGFIVSLFKDYLTSERLIQQGLNERQIKAVLYVKEKGKISNSEYKELNKISKRTATIELTQLFEEFNLFKKEGIHGAGVFYTLIGK